METLIIPLADDLTCEVHWLISRPIRFNPHGKHWPKTTTCRIYYDYGQGKKIDAEDFVVKHDRDVDNPIFARKISLAKALKFSRFSKKDRKRIWIAFFKSADIEPNQFKYI